MVEEGRSEPEERPGPPPPDAAGRRHVIRRAADRELSAAASRLKSELTLFERGLMQTDEAVVILRPDLSIRFANAAFAALVERPLDEVVDETLGAFCPQWTELARRGDTSLARTHTVELLNGAGEPIPVTYQLNTLRDEWDRVSGYLAGFARRQVSEAAELMGEAGRVCAELCTLTELDELGQRTAAAAARLTRADGALVILTDPERRWRIGFPKQAESFTDEPALVADVMRTGKPQVIRDYRRHRGALKTAAEFGLRTLAAIPISSAGRITGAAAVCTFDHAKAFTDDDLERLRVVTAPVGAAVHRVRSVSEADAAADQAHALLDRVPAVIYEARLPDFRIEYVSRDLAALLGLEPAIARNRPEVWRERVHPDDALAVERAMHRAGAGDDFTIQYRLQNASGEGYHWFEERTKVVLDAHGHPARAYGVLTDIHHQKENEAQLVRSERRFRLLFEEMAEGALCQDATGTIVAANSAAYNMLGRKTLVGTQPEAPNWKLLDEAGQPMGVDRWPGYTALHDRRSIRDQLIGVESPVDRRRRWLLVNAVPLEADDPAEMASYTTFTDLTSRREDSERLVMGERKFRRLFENSHNPILIIDQQGHFQDANPAALAFLGHSLGRLQGRNVEDFAPPGRAQGAPLAVDPHLWKEGGRIDAEFQVDGQVKVLNLTVYPDQWEGRAVIVGIGVDVTGERAASAERRRTRAELEKSVAERTRELEAANARLRELDRLKTLFIATMSHELRTPLNSILGFSELLLRGSIGPVPTEQRDLLERIHAAGQALLATADGILEVSRAQAGQLGASYRRFALARAVREAAAAVGDVVRNKGVALQIEIPSDLRLRSDRQRLQQCLDILLSTAIEVTTEGGITIHARRQPELGNIVVELTDTGAALAPPVRAYLNDPFPAISPHEAAESRRLGYGLFLARQLAKQVLKGELSIYPAPGGGNTFTLTLPEDAGSKPDSSRV